MAQQPDITAILAALAAQRPSETPSQPISQPPPIAAYSGAVSAATPSNASAGIPLPQPSNSGSLDLSQIKPQNLGSASIVDTSPKSQNYAADKGTYSQNEISRDEPRVGTGPYGRSRSRSRSPPRRENFRDNYNPYRDERRDDRSNGRDYGRERSFSPNTHARGAFSPGGGRGYQGREKSPPGRSNGDGNTEIVTVDSDAVGLIIGRAGENLRRVEQETGARVQFITGPEASGPQRQCKISGNPRQRAEARSEILRTASENPNRPSKSAVQQSTSSISRSNQSSHQPVLKEGERSIQILVPDRTVGLIIGRGGETIRDLQERSGCHVNIVGENKSINGQRPVNLIGSREAAMKARDLIMEVVESDTRVGGNAAAAAAPPVPYGRSGGFDPYYAAPPASDQYGGSQRANDMVLVPSEAVGMIIGKGGETIKDMQNATGCKINVSPPAGADIDREIGLVGSRMAIENAKRAIWEKVGSVREKQGGPSVRPESRPQYGDPYAQHQPPLYGQPGPLHMPPHMPPMEMPSADPYAAYGGYQNYMAMWYAALANQQGGMPPGQGPPPLQ